MVCLLFWVNWGKQDLGLWCAILLSRKSQFGKWIKGKKLFLRVDSICLHGKLVWNFINEYFKAHAVMRFAVNLL